MADYAISLMENADKSKRKWKSGEVKELFSRCGATKPDNATWGDVQYVFAMMYSDYFPKVLKCDKDLVQATSAYLSDPDAPEGVAFVRWLAVQDFTGDKSKIDWREMC